MDSIFADRLAAFSLRPFQPEDAVQVASWVHDLLELRWISPSTPPPLTADKVCSWHADGTSAFMLFDQAGSENSRALAYGEVNRAPHDREARWLGHLIVAPERRGRGVGGVLVHLLLAEAQRSPGLKRVVLIVSPDNLAGRRCYLRAGFQIVGEEQHRMAPHEALIPMTRMEYRPRSARGHRNPAMAVRSGFPCLP